MATPHRTQPPDPLAPRSGRFRLRWIILVVTAVVLVLNYADRAALGVAGPQMIDDLGLTASEFGLLSSAFFLGYVPFAFIGGWLSDRYGPRAIMGVAIAWWSLFTALTAAGTNFIMLFLIRVLFGFGEGPQGSVSTKTMNNWFPQRQMGTAMGLTQGATPLGGVIGTPLVVMLMAWGGWRAAFVVLGVIGVVCTIGWFAVIRDRPDVHPWARRQDVEEQRERITEVAAPPVADDEQLPSIWFYVRKPIIWATSIAFFGYAWVLYTFLTWFPIYLTQERGVELNELAVAGTIPWVGGVIGFILGGVITDRIAAKTGKPVVARSAMIVVCLTITAVGFALIGLVETTAAAVALMALVVFALYLTGAQYFAIVGDLVPGRRLGGVMGFVHSIANIAGIAAPVTVGAIIDNTGSWATTFTVSAVVCIVGAGLVAVFGRARSAASIVLPPMGTNLRGSNGSTDTPPAGESAQHRALRMVARRILATSVGERIPNISQLRVEIGVGAGTVQKALQEVQQEGWASLSSKPRQGTVLLGRNIGRLWNVAGLPILSVLLPLPNSWEFQGLATGLRSELDRLGIPSIFLYGHGSQQRARALEAHVSHVAVMSYGAARVWSDMDETVSIHSRLTPGSYYAADSVLVVGRTPRSELPQRFRVGIDRLSSDHTRLTEAEFPGADYVEVNYAQVPSALSRGVIDAAVWHRTALGLSLDDQGLHAWPPDRQLARELSHDLSAAAFVVTTENLVVTQVFNEVDADRVLRLQREVVAGDVLPLY